MEFLDFPTENIISISEKFPINVIINEFLIENIPSIIVPSFQSPISFLVTPSVTANEDEIYTALHATNIGLLHRGRTALLSQYNLTSGEVKAYYSGNGYNGYKDPGGLTSFEVTNLNGTPDSVVGSGLDYGKQYPLINLTLIGSPGDLSTVTVDRITAFFKIVAAEKIELGELGDPGHLKMEIHSDLPVGGTNSTPHLIQYDPHANSSRTNYASFTNDYYGNPITVPTSRDRYGQLINYATLKGTGDALLLVGIQSHNGSVNPIFINHGIMLGSYNENDVNKGQYHVAHSFIASGANYADRRFEFHNESDGIIELQANRSIAYYYGDVNVLTNKPHYNIYNNGTITLYGSENIGIKTAGALSQSALALYLHMWKIQLLIQEMNKYILQIAQI